MMFMPKFFHLICIVVVAIYTGNAESHEQKTSVTVLLANENTSSVQISHRFNLHDAEHALNELLGSQSDIISDLDTQRLFSLYIQEHFALRVTDQLPITVNFVGHEVEGNFFWVYQEASIPPSIPQIEIFSDALQSIWKRQTNLVNVEGLGPLQSLRFTINSGWKTILLKPL